MGRFRGISELSIWQWTHLLYMSHTSQVCRSEVMCVVGGEGRGGVLAVTNDHCATVPLPSCFLGSQHRDWRCLAEHIDLHEEDLCAINSEKRVRIIFDEWSKKESVTVEKVHQVLTASQCTRAAECLLSAAQSMVEQEEGDHILDLGGEGTVQSC